MGKTLMDGTEQTLFESTELGEYIGVLFLHNMQSGDAITVNVYIKNVEDGNYYLAGTYSYTDVQTIKAVVVYDYVGKVGIKYTAQQTAGENRTVEHMWFKK